MAARPRTDRGRTLRLACWNAVCAAGSSSWSIFSANTVSICLLDETFINPGEIFRLANYVCHRTDRPPAGGGTAILVQRGIPHHSVPVTGLTQLEATAIQTELAGRPVNILAAYLPHTDRGGPGRLPWRGLPVLPPGDLNDKHVDWNSRLSTTRGNSCVTTPNVTPV
jgi:hypothetical protein